MKTFKKIKFCKLDSMNPNDVHDYIVQYHSESADGVTFFQMSKLMESVGILCQLKCEALHGLGDFKNCRKWSRIPLFFLQVDNHPKECAYDFLPPFVHASMTISACDYSDRGKNYNHLMFDLLSNQK